MDQEFTGANFVKALAEGALKNQVVREGLAKAKDKDPNTILFSEGDCTNWIPIPVKMIEKVEFIRNVPCKEHEHPFVRIHLKSSSDNPEAEVFSRLLASNSSPCLGPSGTEFTALAGALPLQQAGLGELGSAGSIPAMQASASPGGGAQIFICCRIKCMPVMVATGSGGIVIRYVCYIDGCRPGRC